MASLAPDNTSTSTQRFRWLLAGGTTSRSRSRRARAPRVRLRDRSRQRKYLGEPLHRGGIAQETQVAMGYGGRNGKTTEPQFENRLHITSDGQRGRREREHLFRSQLAVAHFDGECLVADAKLVRLGHVPRGLWVEHGMQAEQHPSTAKVPAAASAAQPPAPPSTERAA